MVINKKTSLEKYAVALFYILFNCPLYSSSGPTLMCTWKSSTLTKE